MGYSSRRELFGHDFCGWEVQAAWPVSKFTAYVEIRKATTSTAPAAIEVLRTTLTAPALKLLIEMIHTSRRPRAVKLTCVSRPRIKDCDINETDGITTLTPQEPS
ncbi:hypothetical protein J3458_003565 [Metarhizium acridum]|uniref:uncharacterized protein n=1 Tax=Metarhizium acridum TaxID=92637 RepID=UPI001C6AE6E4|nr:hypothetical protein J3458_003565 [Metarhizium acridum]